MKKVAKVKVAKVAVAPLVQQQEVRLLATGLRRVQWRLRLSAPLFRFATWVAGFDGIKIKVVDRSGGVL